MISENDTMIIYKWLVSRQRATMYSIEYMPEQTGILKAFLTIKARSEREAIDKCGINEHQILKIRQI